MLSVTCQEAIYSGAESIPPFRPDPVRKRDRKSLGNFLSNSIRKIE